MAGAMFVLEASLATALAPMLAHYSRTLHLSKVASGVLVASYAAGLLVGSILGPRVAARVTVKGAAVTGLGVFGLSSVGFGLAGSAVLLDLTRAAQGIGGGLVWVAGLSWVVAVIPAGRQGRAIGMTMSLAIVGTLLGPLLGTLALTLGTEVVFSALGLVSAALMVGLATVPGPKDQEQPIAPVGAIVGARISRVTASMMILVASAVGVMNVVLPLLFDSLGVGHLGIGGIFLAGAAVAAVGSPLIGRLADRRERWNIVRLALLASLLLTLAMAAVRDLTALAPVAVLALACWPLASIPLMTIIVQQAERSGVPTVAAMSWPTVAWALGELVGAPVASGVAQVSSYAVSLVLLALVAVVALVAITPAVRAASPLSRLS
jgi:predicted MFS family arabinose efflux permease